MVPRPAPWRLQLQFNDESKFKMNTIDSHFSGSPGTLKSELWLSVDRRPSWQSPPPASVKMTVDRNLESRKPSVHAAIKAPEMIEWE